MTLEETLGFEFTALHEAIACGTVAIDHRHRQPMDLVHGGVYAAFAESLASHATARAVGPAFVALGLSNSTSFFRPFGGGTLRADAERLHRGRTTWVWDVRFTDGDGKICAASRVTVAVRSAA